MEFKIYSGGDGVVGGGDETLLWTEDHLRNSSTGITITDGVFQVNLGAVTALPGSIDFNNSTIWLSINLGNTNATCTPFASCSGDGEMSPMVRFTASPYAFNADLLDGVDSTAFGQLSTANTWTNTNTFNSQATFNTDTSYVFNGTEHIAVTSDLAGTLNVLSVVATPSSTAGTTAGLFVQQADSANTNGLDNGLVIDNADTNLAITAALKIQNSGGGGYTTIIDNQGTLISGSELNLLDGHTSALVDTATTGTIAITGTGTLNAGAISSGFGAIDTGLDNITTTGTIGTATSTTFTGGLATFTGLTLNQGASTTSSILSTAAPLVDMLKISNSTFPNVTAGVSGLQITYNGGAAAVEASAERIDLTGGTTAGAGAVWNGLRIVQGTITTGTSVQDVKLETAALTQTAANTTNINGLNLAVAGALVQSTAAGTINYAGLNLTSPASTINFAGGTLLNDGLKITQGSYTVSTTNSVSGGVNGIDVIGGSIAPATGVTGTINDINLTTAALALTTTGTAIIHGVYLGSAGALSTGTAAGTIDWSGINIAGPATNVNIAGSSILSDGLDIVTGAHTQSTTGTGIINGIDLTIGTLTASATGGTTNGILIAGGAITASSAAAGTTNAISFSTAALALTSATTQTINGLNMSAAGAISTATNAGASINYSGLNLLTPDATANVASSVILNDGVKLTMGTATMTLGTSLTSNGLDISVGALTPTVTGGTTNGIKIAGGAINTFTSAGTTNGISLSTATMTNTVASTQTVTGISLGTAGALTQNTNAGTINWSGFLLNTPNITQTTGTVVADGLNVLLGSVTTGGKQTGIEFSSIAAPTAGTSTGLYFSDIDFADLHSATAANNNVANIIIKQSAVGNNANTFTIKNDAATPFSLFELRDLTANSNQFGSLAIADAFVSRQSYFGEEFNSFRPQTCGLLVNALTDTHRISRGDWGNAATATVCNTANTSNASGEISTSGVFGAAAATNGCTYANTASNTNGFERTTATTGATAGSTADCLEVLGGAAAANTNNNIFNGSNFPQIEMKWTSSAYGSTQRTFMGISDLATAVANPTTATKGAYFSNCSAPTTPTCGTGLVGAVQDGANAANTVSCPATDSQGQALTAAKWVYGRIEFRKTPAAGSAEIQFFVDYDTSNGVAETSCGTVTNPTASLAASPMSMLNMVVNSAVSLSTTHDVDFFRVWQDDAPVTPVPNQVTTITAAPIAQLVTPPLTINSAPAGPDPKATLAQFMAQVEPEVAAANAGTIDTGYLTASGSIVTPKVVTDTAQVNGLEAATNGDISIKVGGNGQLIIVNSTGQKVVTFDSAGNTKFNGKVNVGLDLSITGSLFASGGLHAGGTSVFGGETTFQKIVNFMDKTVFGKDVSFDSTATFNNDSGGFATIHDSQQEIAINFTKPYLSIPVVTVSVKNGQFVEYSYKDLSSTGFKIVLTKPAVGDIEFAWTALSVKDANTSQVPLPAPAITQ